MTKMIYIPPFAMLSELERDARNFRHLMLPHLLYNERYSTFFSRAKKLGQYIILDNGAAEGQEVAWSRLIDVANVYKVDEFVLPDVMGNPDATLAMAKDFLLEVRGRLPIRTKLGYVLHGSTAQDAIWTYEKLKAQTPSLFSRVEVLYLPRILVTPMNPRARIEVAGHILQTERLPKPIHFLGASPHRIDEGKWIRDGLGGKVRSMDTSAPFVYALRHAYVNDGSRLMRDQDTYFTASVTDHVRHIAMRNCEVMDEWIGSKASASTV